MGGIDTAVDLRSSAHASPKAAPTPRARPRRATILGSTGSIGVNTLDLLAHARACGEADVEIEALTAHRNLERLIEQARAVRPRFVAIGDPALGPALAEALAGEDIETGAGPEAVEEAASRDADWVMAAIVGAAGLGPTLIAAQRGATVALANKECLVCAGEALKAAIARGGGALLPVDSEHNAIFQVFDFDRPHRVTRLILTASGGPFRARSREAMADATPAEAVAHPNWSMGAKISVDSATMMNKGLELIEATHLFPIPEPQIEILVHPQSVIHSMVEYCDGSVLAQMGAPDMRTPIATTLAWPDRTPSPSPRLDFAELRTLTFEAPDPERFPALRLAREAARRGGAASAVMNAANEVAVAAFLEGRARFGDIAAIVEVAMDRAEAEGVTGAADSIQTALAADDAGRRFAEAALTSAHGRR